MADHDTHDHTGVPGVGAPAEILDIPTAETDDTLVLAPDGAGGVEFRAEAGGGAANAVTIIEPAPDPDADDDEGTGADTDPIAGWTTLGTVTTLDRDTTVADHIYLSLPANSGTRIDGAYKAHALADGEAFIGRMDGHDISQNYNRAGIFIGVASPGRIDTMGVINGPSGEVLAMSSPTSFSATVGTLSIGIYLPVYLAIRRNSATSYDFLIGQASPIGVVWRTVVAARNPSMTQAVCGFYANPQNGSTPLKAVFKWMRFYTTLPVALP